MQAQSSPHIQRQSCVQRCRCVGVCGSVCVLLHSAVALLLLLPTRAAAAWHHLPPHQGTWVCVAPGMYTSCVQLPCSVDGMPCLCCCLSHSAGGPLSSRRELLALQHLQLLPNLQQPVQQPLMLMLCHV